MPEDLVPSAFLPHWSQSYSFVSGSQSGGILAVPSYLLSAQVSTLVDLFPDWQGQKGSSAGSHEATRQTGHFCKKGLRKKKRERREWLFISHGRSV